MRVKRGDFATPGTNSPFRDRTPQDNLALFREMRDGLHADGAMVLRAKIDMASPNINLRDPTLYRIKRATHHNTGDRWCIYPMYTYAHPLEDALENITHSICTLEFEDQRPFYDWVLERLAELGLLAQPLPKQYEFARLNLTYIVTSKRKLRQLVEEGIVEGWDDPRMPTLVGMRRRGYTPESLRLLAERSGVSNGGWIDYASLDIALREDLDTKAPRAMAALDPLKLVLTNWDQVIGKGQTLPCSAPLHPGQPERGMRHFTLGPEVWIEREDFMEEPLKGYHRLSPPRFDGKGAHIAGSVVRLKYGYIIQCTGLSKNFDGSIAEVHATLVPDTRSGTPGADAVKTKGVLTWVAAHDALPAEVRLYDRLFTEAQPDAAGRDFKECLNPDSKKVVRGWLEPSLAEANADDKFQFERHGYFVADRKDHAAGAPVFNRITALKDGWAK
jgi:glutaminyl-tRNA synthetase